MLPSIHIDTSFSLINIENVKRNNVAFKRFTEVMEELNNDDWLQKQDDYVHIIEVSGEVLNSQIDEILKNINDNLKDRKKAILNENKLKLKRIAPEFTNDYGSGNRIKSYITNQLIAINQNVGNKTFSTDYDPKRKKLTFFIGEQMNKIHDNARKS